MSKQSKSGLPKRFLLTCGTGYCLTKITTRSDRPLKKRGTESAGKSYVVVRDITQSSVRRFFFFFFLQTDVYRDRGTITFSLTRSVCETPSFMCKLAIWERVSCLLLIIIVREKSF